MRTAAAGAALLVAVVSGCSSSDAAPAEVEPLASGTVSATSTPQADTSAHRAPTTDQVGSSAGVPHAALADTPQGARAFTQYYFAAVVNDAYATGDPSQVAALSDSACGSCANIVADVERLVDAGHRVSGDRFKLKFAEAAPPEPDGSVIVDFRFSSDEYVEVNAVGDVIRSEPPQIDQDAQVKLSRRGSAWTVVAIRTV